MRETILPHTALIGGIIITMLWFYASGLAILMGAELNGVIEQDIRPKPDSDRPERNAA